MSRDVGGTQLLAHDPAAHWRVAPPSQISHVRLSRKRFQGLLTQARARALLQKAGSERSAIQLPNAAA